MALFPVSTTNVTSSASAISTTGSSSSSNFAQASLFAFHTSAPLQPNRIISLRKLMIRTRSVPKAFAMSMHRFVESMCF